MSYAGESLKSTTNAVTSTTVMIYGKIALCSQGTGITKKKGFTPPAPHQRVGDLLTNTFKLLPEKLPSQLLAVPLLTAFDAKVFSATLLGQIRVRAFFKTSKPDQLKKWRRANCARGNHRGTEKTKRSLRRLPNPNKYTAQYKNSPLKKTKP